MAKNKKLTSKITGIILGSILISLTIGFLLSQTFQVKKISAQMSPPSGPLAGVKPVVGTVTVTPGETCTSPNDTDSGGQYCILGQVSLSNPPQNINCVWDFSGNSDPSVNDQWHNCYTGDHLLTGGTQTDIFWKSGNLEFGLQQGGSISFGGGTINIVFSALSQ